jgi:hypothetical protein
MSKQIAEGTALGASYNIYARTGTVDSTDTRSETEVTGNVSGGGGYTSGGTGFSAPVTGSIRSKTTRYQNIFLTDEDGVEHNVSLVNFLVPCKEGHKLTLLLLTSGGSDSGSYFRAYNHNTREHCNHPKAVTSEMFPWTIFMIAMAAIAAIMLFMGFSDSDSTIGGILFLTILVLVLAGLVIGAAGWILAYIRSISVRSNAALKSFVNGLGSA